MVRYLMWLGEWLMSFYLNGGNLSWFIVSNLNGMNWGMQKYLWVSLGIVNGHTENWKLPTATAHSSPKCPSSYLGKTRCKWTLVDEAGWNDAPESSEHVEHDPIHCCEAPLISAVFVGIILISSGRNRVIFGWNRVFFSNLSPCDEDIWKLLCISQLWSAVSQFQRETRKTAGC